EGVGLSSYLLIGFYFLRKSAADAGKKAFLVNRVGDVGFLLGIFLTVGTLGTIKFTEFGTAIAQGHFVVGAPVLTAIALLLFVGATGKSAQIPLYVWLPDAMEGPTPVSALIHAATMVTAGVYMVTRHNALYQMAPVACEVVAVIGALTAIYAASIGLVQNDIKRVLAYSTISQLGYMFLACGVGAFAVGIFHLMTHAFFKALLFLGAGSVIHALSGEQDLRRMGGLAEKIRTTWLTMLAGTLAIAGIPPLAGFFSKDEILGQTFEYSRLLWVIGLVTAGMTAFYMFRLFLMTFHGPSRVPPEAEHHVHESPGTMTGPLMVLAVLSVVGGWIGIGGRFEHFLAPVIAPHGFEHGEAGAAAHRGSVEYLLAIASVGIALAGIGLARRFYLERPELPEQLASRWRRLYQLVYRKYYVDEVYDALFVNRVQDLGTTLASFDAKVVDGLGVDGAGWLTRMASRLSIWWDTWIVDGLVNLGARIVWLFSYPVRMVQTGLVPNYALFIVLGVLVFLGYYGYHLEILRVWKR
ncbi:MAG TPA: NADH-quinone oxidoreductase subunit L, partial [Candidatus Acidoferrales bacterium]|nr:NADH-quinone oxidoreductase subunit L [Candidatus Acidoferrales bacterium]